MAYVERAIEDRIREISTQFVVLLVTGPRQVGKTTLLRHLAASESGGGERHYVTLDDPALRMLAREDPALFLQRFPPPVLIDEVQYAPELLPHVKMHVDERGKPGDFWLTGSQHFQAMQGITESLAGRVAILDLLGFSAREADGREARLPPFLPTPERLEARAGSAASLDLHAVFEKIWRGSFPALIAGPVHERDLFFASYVQTYLQRDVRDLAQVGDESTFLRFLRACAARTGQLLNLSDLARDVDIGVSTARRWLEILEGTRQVYLLRPWHDNLTKRLVKAPKLYFLDTGLAAHLTEWSSARALAAGAMAGAIFETHVVAEILKSAWHRVERPSLWFYRDRDGREIDLVIERDGRLHPIEIKLGATPKKSWNRAFRVLEKRDRERGHGAVVCLYPTPIPLDEQTTVVPVGLL